MGSYNALMNEHEPRHLAPVTTSSDRSFGIVLTIFFAVIGLLPLLGSHPVRIWALVVSGVFLLLALLAPSSLAPLNKLWAKLGAVLHLIVSPIALGVLFFLVVTPTALFMRLFGKDPLRLRLHRSAKSYWIERAPPGPDAASLKNQF
jgi:hypothetical protein